MGTMITYGSYLSKKENLFSSAAWVCTLDTLIALLAGLAIFPALFAIGLEPTIGAGLIFVVLPNIFNKIFLGNLFGTGFFVLLAIASVTSLISIVEVPVAYFIDELKWSRKKSVLSLGAVDWLTNLVSIKGKNYGFLDLMNLLFGQYSLIIGSLGVAIFVGWKWGTSNINKEITIGHSQYKYRGTFAFLIRFLSPIFIAGILIYLILNPNAFA
jgi:NSS family neurotransmitter:Na+ symporter